MNKNKNIVDFILASVVSSYPGEGFVDHLTILIEDEMLSIPNELREKLMQILQSEDNINALRSTYIEIFDHSKSLNPLYETEYGRDRFLSKANELADIAAFYQAFGFELNPDGQKEMIDHISLELEFYSLMKMKLMHLTEIGDQVGIDTVQDAMKKFLKDHLGRFSNEIVARPGVQQDPLYLEIFKWIDEIIKNECRHYDVQPEIIKWVGSEQQGDGEISCGGSVLLQK